MNFRSGAPLPPPPPQRGAGDDGFSFYVPRRGRPLRSFPPLYRWLLLGGAGLLLVLLLLPLLGAWVVRAVVIPRVEARLQVSVQVGDVQVRPSRVRLQRLRVRLAGTRPEELPDLLVAGQVEARFSPLDLLVGRVRLSEVRLAEGSAQLVLGDEPDDPTARWLAQLRKGRDAADHAGKGGKDAGEGRVQGPERVEIGDLTVDARTATGAFRAVVSGLVERGRPSQLVLKDLGADLGAATAKASRATVRFELEPGRFRPRGLPEISVEGGAVAPWKGLALTGIRGTLRPDPERPERALLSLRGGYGGVNRELWDASGWLHPGEHAADAAAELRLRANRFRLSSLDPILVNTPIIETGGAEIDANLNLRYAQQALDFDGGLRLSGLSIFTPRLSAEPVRGLALDLSARGRFEPKARHYRLDELVLRWRGAQAILQAEAEAQPAHLRKITLPGALGPDGGASGPGWRERWRTVSARLVIPPMPCQSMLHAIPEELAPRLQGFELKGTFSTDIRVNVDFAQLLRLPPPEGGDDEDGDAPDPRPEVRPEVKNDIRSDPRPAAAAAPAAAASSRHHQKRRRPVPPLRGPGGLSAPLPGATLASAAPPAPGVKLGKDGLPQAVTLSGKVGIDGCQVLQSPEDMNYEKLVSSFPHSIEVEPGKIVSFVIGPEDPDFVPYEEISPYLVNSIMTTEDNGFMRHRGFIGPEFRSALEQNLQRGYFRLGASSITMQTVKNVLLSREKTLSRKLQELFLTWYLEQNLTKERILEIYFNAIEFGPYLYGIGRASRHYFGKTPKELTPREAAWFSSILPNPKRRYVHFCKGKPDQKWEAYLTRILRRVHERGRLTDEEFQASLEERFEFNREEAPPEKECLALIKRLTEPQPPAPGTSGAPAPAAAGTPRPAGER